MVPAMWIRIGALVAILWVAALPAAGQSPPKPPANDDCLACHDATAKRDDGRSIGIDAKVFDASTHGPMACVDCHQDLAVVTEFPHASTLKPVSCASCHDGPQAQYAAGVHGQSRERGQTLAASCADCHGTHGILSAANPQSPTNHLNLPRTCGRCHGDAAVIKGANIQIGDVASKYHDSIHGKAVEKAGLLVAPTCGDCHGNHDIRRLTDPKSPVFRTNVPVTCGKCHAGIRQRFDVGVHGAALARGSSRTPVCKDCHTAHAIKTVDTESWRLSVTRECGTCHQESQRTFRDTFHGQVTSLGFVRVAACADCHGAHDIFAKSDARSTVSPGHLIETCSRCHAGANAGFVQYDPHADRLSKTRGAALYYAAKFMNMLLLGVFVFFGVHTALWLPRGMKARREARR
jgi:Cytochrome c7 and related cytochrome c